MVHFWENLSEQKMFEINFLLSAFCTLIEYDLMGFYVSYITELIIEVIICKQEKLCFYKQIILHVSSEVRDVIFIVFKPK